MAFGSYLAYAWQLIAIVCCMSLHCWWSILLQVSFQTLSVRLSYNDIRLFMAIINSMPQQLLNAYPSPQPKNVTSIGLLCVLLILSHDSFINNGETLILLVYKCHIVVVLIYWMLQCLDALGDRKCIWYVKYVAVSQ